MRGKASRGLTLQTRHSAQLRPRSDSRPLNHKLSTNRYGFIIPVIGRSERFSCLRYTIYN